MKEIGGYIEFEYNHGKMLHENAILLNCGRRAFSYLIKSKGINKIWIPRFSCGSVSEPFEKEKCDIHYYPVGKDFLPLFNDVPSEDWIVLINYYGQVGNKKINDISLKYSHIIVDNTQAYFQEPVEGIDTVYTCRKFFGVTDGAILYTDKILTEEYSVDESYSRMKYLLGRFERTAQEFYESYAKNNDVFNDEPIKRMSKLTENILHGIDYENVAQRRKSNFAFLHNKFNAYNKLELVVPEGAFMYPLYIEGGGRFRKILQEKRIYIPTLWPDVLKLCSENDEEYRMACDILPLPVDQRYSLDDIKYMALEVLRCIS